MAFDVYAEESRHNKINVRRIKRCFYISLEMVRCCFVSSHRVVHCLRKNKIVDFRIRSVHQHSSKHRFATLLWDNLPHGGASQVHPHIHATVQTDHFYGKNERFSSNRKRKSFL